MKKFWAIILLAVIFTGSLFSCENKNGEGYSFDWSIDETILHPDYPDYPSIYDVQIPKFNLKSPYSDVINAEIKRRFSGNYSVTADFVIENARFEAIKTKMFENGDMLSVLMIRKRDTWGTDGDVFTFNWDLKNKMPATINYEFEKAGIIFDEINTPHQAIISIHGAGAYMIENISYDNFYYNENGDLILAMTYIYRADGADSWRKMCFYNVATEEITPFEGYEKGAEGVEFKIG